jgi:methylenetetrahydrofolate dehydrogenase (NADP+)/methenyltetrahydrofolate cyclohydrolase
VEKILKGEAFATPLKEKIRIAIRRLCKKGLPPPVLCSIQVVPSAAFSAYVSSQKKCAQEMGVEYRLADLSRSRPLQILNKIKKLSKDKRVQGIVVQMPLPDYLSPQEIAGGIEPAKDLEGITPYNLGRLQYGRPTFVSPTALAAFRMAKAANPDLKGKEAVIVGHSALVGKPLSMLFLSELATTTVCHIGTYERERLVGHIRNAEILCVAVGKPEFIKGEWIPKGSTVIDIGINKKDGALVGDVEFDKALELAAHITPVPGGVGVFTTAILFENLVKAAYLQKGETVEF